MQALFQGSVALDINGPYPLIISTYTLQVMF